MYRYLCCATLVGFSHFAWGSATHPIVVDSTANKAEQASVAQAQNGINVINITKPRLSGWSINRFDQLHVDPQGVIVNNSNHIGVTKLGGVLYANPQLQGEGMASGILMDVTGSDVSRLDGVMELFGQDAHIVLTNPHGISCNGCGFIASSGGVIDRLTVAAARPVFNSGGLAALEVNQGYFKIGEHGMDVQSVNYADVIARAAEINGKFWAGKKLAVALGKNHYHATQEEERIIFKAAQRETAVDTPEVALDVAAVGGMYADAIYIIGTEKGFGVRSAGELYARGGDIELDVDKAVQLGDSYAQGNIKIESASDNVTIQGNMVADAVEIAAAEELVFTEQSDVEVVTSLVVSADEGITNQSRLKSHGIVRLDTLGDINNEEGSIAALGQIFLQSGNELKNTGQISSSDILTIESNAVINQSGLIQSGKNLTMVADRQIENTAGAAIYSQGDAVLTASEIINDKANILAQGNLLLDSRNAIRNISAVIEATGHIGLHANEVINKKATLTFADAVIASTFYPFVSTEEAPPPEDFGSRDAREIAYIKFGNAKTWAEHRYLSGYGGLVSGSGIRVNEVGTVIEQDSPASFILSGGNIAIEADSLTNDASHIAAAGDVVSHGTALDNIGYQLNKETHVACIYPEICRGHSTLYDISYYIDGRSHGVKVESTEVSGTIDATIFAGGTITGVFSEHINNNTIQTHVDSLAFGASFAKGVKIDGANIPVTEMVDATAFIRLPEGAGGLYRLDEWVEGESGGVSFLISTNIEYDPLAFIGSAYFFEQTGIAYQGPVKLLGDAYYETQLIKQAILAQTGKRFLVDNISSDYAQMRMLMDHAIDASTELEITPGIALTQAQMNQLQKDILWWVEQEVQGKTVLVPRVYLSRHHKNQQKSHGAMMVADNIHLQALQVTNKGGVKASHVLALEAKEDIRNFGGLLSAGESLSLTAGNNIFHESVKQETRFDARNNMQWRVASGEMVSGGNIDLRAEKNISTKAANIQAGGDISLQAGQDITLGEQAYTNEKHMRFKEGFTTSKRIEHIGSTLQSDGDITFDAGKNIYAISSHVQAGQDVAAKAQGDIGILAVQNRYYAASEHRSKKPLSAKYKATESWDLLTQSSLIEAGRNLLLESGHDLTIHGSDVRAEQKATVVAGRQSQTDGAVIINKEAKLSIMASEDEHYRFSYEEKTGVDPVAFGLTFLITDVYSQLHSPSPDSAVNAYKQAEIASKKSETHLYKSHDILPHASQIQAGKGLSIQSTGDVIIAGSHISDQTDGEIMAGYVRDDQGDPIRVNDDARLTLTSQQATHYYKEEHKKQRPDYMGIMVAAPVQGAKYAVHGGSLGDQAVRDIDNEFVTAIFDSGENATEVMGQQYSHRVDEETLAAQQESKITFQTGAGMISTGEIEMIGSHLAVGGDAVLQADRGITISAAEENTQRYGFEENKSFDGFHAGYQNGRLHVGATGSKTKDSVTHYSTQAKSSHIKTGHDLTLETSGEASIIGSVLDIGQSLQVNAIKDVTIASKEQVKKEHRETEETTIQTSISVGNSYVDAAFAIKALHEARLALEDAKKALDAAKNDPRITDYSDYELNIALATANVVSAGIAVSTAIASATASSYTYGFNASITTSEDTKKSSHDTLSITHLPSSVLIKQGDAAVFSQENVMIKGSDIIASEGGIKVEAENDITLLASKESHSAEGKEKSHGMSITASYSGGNSGSGSGSVRFGSGSYYTELTEHRYANVAANEGVVSLDADEKIALSGAQVKAKEIAIQAQDLTLESLQNTYEHHSEHSNISLGAGGTFGSGGASVTSVSAGYGQQKQDASRAWVDEQTRINGSEQVTIDIEGQTHLKGAVVMAENNELRLKTGRLTYEEINDHDRSSQQAFQVDITIARQSDEEEKSQEHKEDLGWSRGNTSFAMSRQGKETTQVTHATIGQGELVVKDENMALDALNRDIEKAQELTGETLTGGLNIALSFDHRLLTTKGRSEILKELNISAKGVEILYYSLFPYGVPAVMQAKFVDALQSKDPQQIDALVKQFEGRGLSEGELADITLFYEGKITVTALSERLSEASRKRVLVNIGVFSDGTWKDANKIPQDALDGRTNLWVLADIYQGEKKYIPGIGSGNIIDKYLCGALACGWNYKVSQGLRFVRDSYVNEDEPKIVVLDTAGFSRGSAQTRDLVNRLLYQEIPGVPKEMLVVRSELLFDTVAASGLPFNGTDIGRDLSISPDVNFVRHASALNEYRYAFDLHSVRQTDGTILPNVKEQSFLGAHSNIGGAYLPGRQGKQNQLSNIPLSWIYSEAKEYGLPYASIPSHFVVSPELYDLYQRAQTDPSAYQQLQQHYIHDERLAIEKGNVERVIYYHNP